MVIGGISKTGSYHERNQDSFLCEKYKDGVILVVSDGMGSKSLSHYGSKCLCESIVDVISNLNSALNYNEEGTGTFILNALKIAL